MPRRSNDIDTTVKRDARSLAASKRLLGDTFTLGRLLLDEYDALESLVLDRVTAPKDVATTTFLWLCRYQLVIGSESILRGHLPAGFSQLRLAIEAAAFAVRIKRVPDLARVWLDSADGGINGPAYEKYREKFQPGKLFPKDHKTLGGALSERYDLCSKFSHPSLFSLSYQLTFRRLDRHDPAQLAFDFREVALQMGFNYAHVANGSKGNAVLAQSFLFTIQTHALILNVLFEACGDFPKDLGKAWKARQKALDGVVKDHLLKWKPLIYRR